MNRKRKIIAALADLKQDIAGPIPVELVSKWTRGNKTPQEQKVILEPFLREGYLVSSDSSGLSRLMADRSLLEVMKVVSEPKEVIYHLGRGIGGRGVGVWAADNTEMFYPLDKVGARELLDTMAAAQKVIHRGPLQVGMAIHRGKFWEIGQGMFGEEAEVLEAMAEDFTEGKEIVVSGAFKADLPEDWHGSLARREDLRSLERGFFSVNYDQMGEKYEKFILPPYHELSEDHNFYPIPFDRKFFLALKRMDVNTDDFQLLKDYFSLKTVLLIKVYHKKVPLLLDQLTDWVVVNAILNEIAGKYQVDTVKSNGDTAIFVADDEREALALAEETLESMRSSEDKVSIGLARGEVLVFQLDGGGCDIAGEPVNIASKISEDIPDQNSLYVDVSIKIPANRQRHFVPYQLEKSRVVLRGMRFVE